MVSDTTRLVETRVDPIAFADRLVAMAQDATAKQRHEDALILYISADLLRKLSEARQEALEAPVAEVIEEPRRVEGVAVVELFARALKMRPVPS